MSRVVVLWPLQSLSIWLCFSAAAVLGPACKWAPLTEQLFSAPPLHPTYSLIRCHVWMVCAFIICFWGGGLNVLLEFLTPEKWPPPPPYPSRIWINGKTGFLCSDMMADTHPSPTPIPWFQLLVEGRQGGVPIGSLQACVCACVCVFSRRLR